MDEGQREESDRSPLPHFILLYAIMYAAFGVASPFWPRFFEERGIPPEELGLLLALGTAVRLVSGLVAGRAADQLGARRGVLTLCIGASGIVALALVPAEGFLLLLVVNLCLAATLAPVTTLADALAARAVVVEGRSGKFRFEYGWVRGTGSAAFIIGTLVAGQVVSATGLTSVILLHASLLVGAAFAAWLGLQRSLEREIPAKIGASPKRGVLVLFRLQMFRRLLLVAALVLGSHALHDAFAVIRWNAAGISPGLASLFWSLSVAGEVIVFFLIGPPLVERAGPAAAAAIAAAAGTLRWVVMALSSEPLALVLVQPMHGLTFALLHLACMRLLTQTVPPQLAATGQAIYAVSAAIATMVVTLAAGALYARLGGTAFFAMAGLCAAALPLTLGLRSPAQ